MRPAGRSRLRGREQQHAHGLVEHAAVAVGTAEALERRTQRRLVGVDRLKARRLDALDESPPCLEIGEPHRHDRVALLDDAQPPGAGCARERRLRGRADLRLVVDRAHQLEEGALC